MAAYDCFSMYRLFGRLSTVAGQHSPGSPRQNKTRRRRRPQLFGGGGSATDGEQSGGVEVNPARTDAGKMTHYIVTWSWYWRPTPPRIVSDSIRRRSDRQDPDIKACSAECSTLFGFELWTPLLKKTLHLNLSLTSQPGKIFKSYTGILSCLFCGDLIRHWDGV